MRVLAIDIGSSSVKAAVLTGRRSPQPSARVSFATRYVDDGDKPRAEVALKDVDRAVRKAIDALGSAARGVDLVVPATMAPSWIALDKRGSALTPIVTHQDRRGVDEAAEIERRVGRSRHLRLAGNRPFPGGISSTTWAWHLAHEKSQMRRAALVGHLGTWLAFALTGARVIDASNAGFTGLLDVRRLAWSEELIDAVGVNDKQLPQVVDSSAIVGRVTTAGARRFGLTPGTPMLAGCIDGSAAMLAAGAGEGQLVNVCGSTDVLALCTSAPHPHADLLTRPLGVGRRWLSVATIAASGSALSWAQRTFFSDEDDDAFHARLRALARRPLAQTNCVSFRNALAGSRTAMEVVRGAMDGLTLSTTRDDLLAALVHGLARESASRVARFQEMNVPIGHDVFVTGGAGRTLLSLIRREWPKRFRFRLHDEATSRGLYALAKRSLPS